MTMTKQELEQIARLCVQEQGGSEAGVKGEASLMANLARKHGREVYEYVRNSGWFSKAKFWMEHGQASLEQISWVEDVLVNGHTTIPSYVDEHDCFSDIVSISTGNIYSRKSYIKDVTVIKNKYGATYTFWGFLHEHSDPFGYTSKPAEAATQQDGIFLKVGD